MLKIGHYYGDGWGDVFKVISASPILKDRVVVFTDDRSICFAAADVYNNPLMAGDRERDCLSVDRKYKCCSGSGYCSYFKEEQNYREIPKCQGLLILGK